MKKVLLLLLFITVQLSGQKDENTFGSPYRDGDLCGISDTSGKVIFKLFAREVTKYSMNPVDSSTRIVSRTDKEFKVTDQNSKVFMPETDVDSVYFSDYEHNQIKSYKNGKVGLYRKGVKFMNFKYDKIKPDLNDSYIVTKSGKEGVINSKGKIVVPIMYDAVFPDFDYDYS